MSGLPQVNAKVGKGIGCFELYWSSFGSMPCGFMTFSGVNFQKRFVMIIASSAFWMTRWLTPTPILTRSPIASFKDRLAPRHLIPALPGQTGRS
ncbi:hypothetical protein Pan14r_44960 [Crateriforma conspicua]|uniref:Uncharacterized protein n=1 Tax=Crateriforma conspicua TaxID=2527996 RepID=A0A5C5YB59_9PLAN|nr:hypothetical protein Pan14r_44960 [Crateriforma conspicua]